VTQNIDRSNAGLLVLYALPQEANWESLHGGQWRVLSFLAKEEEERFLEAGAAHGIEVVEVTRAAQAIDAAALRAREKYCAFIADWPERFHRQDRNFKELFTHRGEVAYWWLTYASIKHNETSPTFEYLCHLEIIRKALQVGVERCVLIGLDPMIALLVGRACVASDVSFHAPGAGPVRVKRWGLRGLVARPWYAWRLLIHLVVFRIIFRPQQGDSRAKIGFFSLFPELLRIDNGAYVDRQYGGLPGFVSQQPGLDVVFLASFAPASWRNWRLLWRQRSALRSRRAPSLLFLESYLRLCDLALVMSTLSFVFRFIWLDRFDRGYRESFQYDGISIFELVGPEFAYAFLGNQLPHHLTLARLVERAVRDHSMTHLVSFTELYPPGRAIYYGAKKGRHGIVTVAYQHANVNRMKLYHSYRPTEVVPRQGGNSQYVSTMPLPDLYLFQGENGMRVIRESGYPEERCRVTGSPRYDALAHLLQTRVQGHATSSAQGNDGAKTVLVTPSVEEQQALELVETCVKACAASPLKLRVVVKPHPSTPLWEAIPVLQNRYNFPDVQVQEGDLYQLILDADVVVASYSTAGDEAIALGRSVVCYTGLRPSMSSFLDIPAAPLAHDAEELRTTLERILSDPNYLKSYKTQWSALIEGSFYRLDGKACHRMLEALLERS
jgi:surface carbohydrate biosynthesis protein (TIGR04326 family)